ncbi:4Fe-4S cluster-binding domain-containing protein [Candidatus Pacearchaeota archaeon]|nr:4Fe-4S cluster-binding domain-containing protein [Candidatus Pacearchaeota archaeon]
MKELTIEVTNQCCLCCVHCSTRAGRDFEDDLVFLPRRKVKEVLYRFADFEKIRFSGGEPFIRPGIINIFHDAKTRGKFVEVLTSGYFWGQPIPEDLIRKCKAFVDLISFSIYGDEWVHQNVTREYSLKCLDKSVDRVISHKIPFGFNFVALKKSIPGLEYVMQYVGKRASEVKYYVPSLRILRFIQQGYGEGRADQAINEDEIERVKEMAKSFAEKYHVDLKIGCSFAEQGCTQGEGKAVVTAKGEYLNCSALKYGSLQGPFACREKW